MWNDPAIGIEWPALEGDAEFDPSKVILSKRSKERPPSINKGWHIAVSCYAFSGEAIAIRER